ncbi:MAG: hypothetical protein ACR2II_07210 [Chthoniobacterales bacterium]
MHSPISALAERTLRIAVFLVAAVYLITGVAYLCLDYWPYTETDFWQIYQVCFYYPWWQSALFKIHNHSLFFPSFFWLADLHFFHGSQLVLFVAGLCLQTICTVLLLLPLWRDSTLEPTARSLGIMTIVVASFWMGRAAITTSGGFNCITSLALLGAVSAFLLLPRMQLTSRSRWQTSSLVIGCGFVATFSFGSGAAVWPTLLFLGWSLRVSWRSLVSLFLAGLVATLIYKFLPPPEDQSELWHSLDSTPILALASFKHLCRFIGAPAFYSIEAWQGVKMTGALIESSRLLLFIGAVGLCLAVLLLATSCFRRNLRGQQLEFLGLALIGFNLCVALLAVISRVERFQDLPVDAAAPRYFYWSSLFWAGLLLVVINHANCHRWLRGSCIALVVAFPVLGWQFHRDEGLHWRYARLLAMECGTSLINNVADPERLLAPSQDQVDNLLPTLRARRLDMFAARLQDLLGQPVSRLFNGREDPIPFRGRAAAELLHGGRDQATVVKISGQLIPQGTPLPTSMVIVDSQEKVAGIASSFESNTIINKILFGGRMPNGRLVGYIRDYQASTPYVLRAISQNGVSTKQIPIAPLPRGVK